MPKVEAIKSTASALRRKARRPKPQVSPFGGFKKRAIAAPQLAGSVVAPAVLAHLSIASGRPLLETARSLIRYTECHDQKVATTRAAK